jgi:hypothetical protein
MFAARLYWPEGFAIPAGPRVEFEPEFLTDVAEEMPQLRRKSLPEIAADRRFAQALYRLTIRSALLDEVEDPGL